MIPLFSRRLAGLFLCCSVSTYAQKNIDISEKVSYLKTVPLFVATAELKDENKKMLDEKLSADAQTQLDALNKAMKAEFKNAWGLSDSVVFVGRKEFELLKRKLRNCIFAESVDHSIILPEQDFVHVSIAFKFQLPAKSNFFKNDALFTDSSRVSVITTIRVARNNFLTGSIWNNQSITIDKILFNKEATQLLPQQSYVGEIRTKYREIVEVVNTAELLKVIHERKPGYVYSMNR